MASIEELAKEVENLKRLAESVPRGPSTIASEMVVVDGVKRPGIVAREIQEQDRLRRLLEMGSKKEEEPKRRGPGRPRKEHL